VKRKKPASPASPEKRRSTPRKTGRTGTKKAKTQVGTGKTKAAGKSPKKKTAAKAETSAPRRVSSRVKTKKAAEKPAEKTIRGKSAEPYTGRAIKRTKGAKPAEVRKAVSASPPAYGRKSAGKKKAAKPEKPVKEARRSLKGRTASKITGRPARRKVPSLKTPVLEKGRWEDRERFPELPREYGENDLLIMAVDPGTVYAAWEITRDRLPGGGKDLALRLVDAAGGGASRDIRVAERVGSGFFEIRMPGTDIVAEIGLLSAHGKFMPILRSPVVSFPRLPAFDELEIVRKLFEAGIRAGY
jgi:hypothetical protein